MKTGHLGRRHFEPPRRKRVLMLWAYYEHRMHLGMARHAHQANWIVDSTTAHYRYAMPPKSWRGDGILALFLPERRELLRYLRKADVPIVSLTSDVEGIATARVILDNHRIGRIAAEHLLERGFRNLAFLKCTDYADVRGREAGFAAAVEEAGLCYQRLDWHAAARRHPRLGLHAWLARRLRDLPLPLGVMAQSDHRAYDLIDACQLAGLGVPEQIAVVGVDNDQYTCEFAPISITSVDSGRQELGFRGAELLDRLMRGEPPPAQPILIPPAGLVLRQSSDILAVVHPGVARALSFIWKFHAQRIGVDDVVAAAAMSRCSLYQAFERHVGRTIRQEIERKRIENACRLLLTTANKVSHVARVCGFSSGEQFCRVFTSAMGTNPRDFRQGRRRAKREDAIGELG